MATEKDQTLKQIIVDIIKNDTTYDTKADRFLEQYKNSKDKQKFKEICDYLNLVITSKQTKPMQKFNGLKLTLSLSEMDNEVFMSQLAISNLLKQMTELGQHNHQSSDEDRGIDLFGVTDQEGYSTQALILILECIQHWSELYPVDMNQKNTPFKDKYESLLKIGVTFPQDNMFIMKPVRKKMKNNNSNSILLNNVQIHHTKFRQQLEIIASIIDHENFDQIVVNELIQEFNQDKINILQCKDILNQIDNLNLRANIEKDIQFISTHDNINNFIKNQKVRKQIIKDIEILLNSNIQDHNSQHQTQQLSQIPPQQQTIQSIPKHNLNQDYNTFGFNNNANSNQDNENEFSKFDNQFDFNNQQYDQFQQPNLDNKNKKQSVMQSKIESDFDNFKERQSMFNQDQQQFDQFNEKQSMNQSNQQFDFDNFKERQSFFNPPLPQHKNKQEINQQQLQQIQEIHVNNNILNKQSPIQDNQFHNQFPIERHTFGNANDNDQLMTKKLSTQNNKENHGNLLYEKTQNQINLQNNLKEFQSPIISKKHQESFNQNFNEKFSEISKTTFNNTNQKNFPFKNNTNNPKNKKNYGQKINIEDCQIELPNLNPSDRNMTRFKLSSLKKKNSLFEVSYLQVGIISYNFFDVKSSKNYVKFELFFGNKMNHSLNDFQVEYLGDENVLLWVKPEVMQSEIKGKQQIKQELVVNYLNIPYNIISFNISFTIPTREEAVMTVNLPMFLNKFMIFKKIDNQVFKYKWGLKKELAYFVEIPNVNPKLIKNPQNYLEKYFSHLVELNSFEKFNNQKQDEFVQFKLGGMFELNQPGVEYLLKIILRPDSSILIQVISSIVQPQIAQEIIRNFGFLLQKDFD